MSSFHVVCGLPRAGSTLLQNILNQNPRFRCSSTSCLPHLLGSLQSTLSHSPELKSELIRDREGTLGRIRRTMWGVIDAWHPVDDATVRFDKSRLWNTQIRLLEWLGPDIKVIVCVRDLRDVMASMEKQHARSAVFDDAQTPGGRTLFERASNAFAPEGVIGSCLMGVDDLLRRRPASVHIVKYEDLVAHPRRTLVGIYEEIGEEEFEHDFKEVLPTSSDVDELYLLKFPHEGSGEVQPGDPGDRDRWLSPDVSQQIVQKFNGYNSAFGYGS